MESEPSSIHFLTELDPFTPDAPKRIVGCTSPQKALYVTLKCPIMPLMKWTSQR